MTDNIISKIEKIEKLLISIKKDLSDLVHQTDNPKPTQIDDKTAIDAAIKEYDGLYEEFIKGNLDAVKSFVNRYTKPQLVKVFKSKRVPIDVTKTSKTIIAKSLTQLMNQRMIITK